jgi:ABC-2 type transport system permease protein
VVNAVSFLAASIEKEALAALLSSLASPGFPVAPPAPGAAPSAPPALLEARLSVGPGGEAAIPNAVQQNVPAWTMFAMFFIVVPLSGMIIREKGDMISLRLLTMPSAFVTRVAGKVSVFLVVCLAQFLLMVGVGMHLLPRFGVPALVVGDGWPPLLVMAAAAALAATGYGILVGTVATSTEQAASFGAVSIIIAAVIGGVMVPSFAMPAAMRPLSALSPLHWGLSGFLDVFLRGATVADILPDAGKLVAFAAAAMLASWLWFRSGRRA